MRAVLLCLVAGAFAGSAVAQSSAAPGSPAFPRSKPAARSAAGASAATRFKPEIPVSSPIFTLDGVCPAEPKASSKSSACKTVMTRGQLEALVNTIDPQASPKLHQQFALSYARLLAATKLAEQRKLDKDPSITREIQLQQSLIRMQILTDYLLRGLTQQAQHVADSEIEAYYKSNAARYEQAQMERVAIPLGGATESGKPLDSAAAKAEMEQVRESVAKGDDFEFLQSKVYKDLELKGPPPVTSIAIARHQSLSPEELKAFDMSLGETSPVFENQGVLFILRLVSKRQLTINEVRAQIEATLALQHEADKLHQAVKGIDAEFNLKYLDIPTQPELFPLSMVTQSQLHRGLHSVMKLQP